MNTQPEQDTLGKNRIRIFECPPYPSHECYDHAIFSLDQFVAHARGYQNGELPERPWCIAESVDSNDHKERTVLFTFSDKLLETLVNAKGESIRDWKKDFTAALSYGYIGHTNGGRNGIVQLRDEDDAFWKCFANYCEANRQELANYHIGSSVQGVKLVAHRPNGMRTIGVHDVATNHILFFDQRAYKQ